MFIACMYVLVFREMARPTSRRRPLNKPLVLACVVLFMSITTVCRKYTSHHRIILILWTKHWCLNFTRAFHAFVKNGDKPNGPLESFARLSDPLNVTKTGLYMLDIIIGDLIMVNSPLILPKKLLIKLLSGLSSVGCVESQQARMRTASRLRLDGYW